MPPIASSLTGLFLIAGSPNVRTTPMPQTLGRAGPGGTLRPAKFGAVALSYCQDLWIKIF